MWKWPCIRGVLETLEKLLQISYKVNRGFFQITRKVKAVVQTLDSKYSRITFYGTSTRFLLGSLKFVKLQKLIHLHEVIQLVLRGTEKLNI